MSLSYPGKQAGESSLPDAEIFQIKGGSIEILMITCIRHIHQIKMSYGIPFPFAYALRCDKVGSLYLI